MPPTFDFYGKLAITLRILDNDYTLVGTSDLGQGKSTSMRLAYHSAFDDSIEVGTIEELFTGLAGLSAKTIKLGSSPLNSLPVGATAVDPTAVARSMMDKAKLLPGLSEAMTELTTAKIRITDLELFCKLPTSGTDPSLLGNSMTGALTVGIGLDYRSATTKPNLVGISLETVTLLVTVAINIPV